ncbi:MAG: nucleoside hydrolase [Kurthia sp.]|uniref:Pyrimidine-specific ribonucleoside hydrolase n=1 Tax=Kurthia zopfii TaxID=1650 RepID=A0A8B4Q862_9BACL|nr:nucleoside hydrolase [Kurthia zopfii]PWI21810.1 nucleoside hydrolase [Kurthia zopfii]TDR34084.1 pyrimidine-specific ribonucleoside hydrolase [Kurthia zopfii]GEK32052.1 pyrimidine-specific ribonucleoside hydrolase RihA [Kurthia zopfii]STX08515.1 Pyrimidine-specific ribonucleoside hydrolase rihA [Kurthia zopfii]
MTKIPVIIDCDPGIDDAMMLTLAFARPELDIKLVTVEAGNLTMDKTTYNTLSFLTYINERVEVAKGIEQPMFRKQEVAEDIHGEGGLGNVKWADPSFEASERPAIQAMVDTLLNAEEPVTIVATGPLTNIAALLFAHPEVKSFIKQISWMGGAAVGGNMSTVAEFNAYVDPHAVEFVFRSGVPIIMSGLDVTHKAYITREEMADLSHLGTPFAEKVADMMNFYTFTQSDTPFYVPGFEKQIRVHDICAVACLIEPEMFKGDDYFVEVELNGSLTQGATLVDYTNRTGNKPNVHVLHTVNREAFIELFFNAVTTIGKKIQ